MSESKFTYAEQAVFCQPFLDVMAKLVSRTNIPELTAANLVTELSNDIMDSVNISLEAGFPPEAIQEAQFALCAWCDEFIMNANWNNVSDIWPEVLMQKVFFNTTLAGEQFFVHLNSLNGSRQLALDMYAFCLMHGFKGKYVYDLALTELASVRNKTLQRVLQSTHLEEAKSPTFPSLDLLSKSPYQSWNNYRGLFVFAAVLICFAMLSTALAGLLHSEISRVIRIWI